MTLEEYIHSLQNKSIAVIGIGVSNTPLIERLCENGCDVTACDKRSREQMGAEGDRRVERLVRAVGVGAARALRKRRRGRPHAARMADVLQQPGPWLAARRLPFGLHGDDGPADSHADGRPVRGGDGRNGAYGPRGQREGGVL